MKELVPALEQARIALKEATDQLRRKDLEIIALCKTVSGLALLCGQPSGLPQSLTEAVTFSGKRSVTDDARGEEIEAVVKIKEYCYAEDPNSNKSVLLYLSDDHRD